MIRKEFEIYTLIVNKKKIPKYIIMTHIILKQEMSVGG